MGDAAHWRHARVVLRPDSDKPAYPSIEITETTAQGLRVLAVFLEVLGVQ